MTRDTKVEGVGGKQGQGKDTDPPSTPAISTNSVPELPGKKFSMGRINILAFKFSNFCITLFVFECFKKLTTLHPCFPMGWIFWHFINWYSQSCKLIVTLLNQIIFIYFWQHFKKCFSVKCFCYSSGTDNFLDFWVKKNFLRGFM